MPKILLLYSQDEIIADLIKRIDDVELAMTNDKDLGYLSALEDLRDYYRNKKE